MKLLPLFIFCPFLFLSACRPFTQKPAEREVKADALPDQAEQPALAADEELRRAYSSAIAEYIEASFDADQPTPDTLFIGKHPDFPDISLPDRIQDTPVLLLTPAEADPRVEYHTSMVYLNVIGWVNKNRAEFLIVTFLVQEENGAAVHRPQHNCVLELGLDAERNKYVRRELRFEYPYHRQDNG